MFGLVSWFVCLGCLCLGVCGFTCWLCLCVWSGLLVCLLARAIEFFFVFLVRVLVKLCVFGVCLVARLFVFVCLFVSLLSLFCACTCVRVLFFLGVGDRVVGVGRVVRSLGWCVRLRGVVFVSCVVWLVVFARVPLVAVPIALPTLCAGWFVHPERHKK